MFCVCMCYVCKERVRESRQGKGKKVTFFFGYFFKYSLLSFALCVAFVVNGLLLSVFLYSDTL